MKNLELLKEQEVLGKEFRVYGTAERPLFLAKDVANWIEHTDLSRMVNLVDKEEKLKRTLYISGQNREMWFLTEDGVYEVLMQSRKPIAKAFKKEVKNILKTIRKHGVYMTDSLLEQTLSDPDFLIGVLTELKEERQNRKLLEKENKKLIVEIEENKPKIKYLDEILLSTNTMAITQIAKDYGMSARKLNEILHAEKIQYKTGGQWVLYAKYVNCGYTKSNTYIDNIGEARVTTKWTQKGRVFIHELLTDLGYIAIMDKN